MRVLSTAVYQSQTQTVNEGEFNVPSNTQKVISETSLLSTFICFDKNTCPELTLNLPGTINITGLRETLNGGHLTHLTVQNTDKFCIKQLYFQR